MGIILKTKDSPEFLNENWDKLADHYFQKREFLLLLHKTNPCSQRYYELYRNDIMVAGTVVYTLKVNILTFSNINLPLKLLMIGLPVSVAAPPLIGESSEFENLVNEILKVERGLTLCLNLKEDVLRTKVVCMRTLPTIVFRNQFDDFIHYKMALRHPYRRRIKQIQRKFDGVRSISTDCSTFSEVHYELYMNIMKRTPTKVEVLLPEFFRSLPENFILTSHYNNEILLSWQIVSKDGNSLFFLFGGMNYKFRDSFQSYNNNLLSILTFGIDHKFSCIDFGQTAEVAKCRLGCESEERRMFFYHPNYLINLMLRLFKKFITYSKPPVKERIFNNINSFSATHKSKQDESIICSSGSITVNNRITASDGSRAAGT